MVRTGAEHVVPAELQARVGVEALAGELVEASEAAERRVMLERGQRVRPKNGAVESEGLVAS